VTRAARNTAAHTIPKHRSELRPARTGAHTVDASSAYATRIGGVALTQ